MKHSSWLVMLALLPQIAVGGPSTSSTATAPPSSLELCTSAWSPFSVCTADSEPASGTLVDELRLKLAERSIKLQVRCLPWKRCLKEAFDGKVDGILAASESEERASQLRYTSVPLATVSYVFVTLKGSRDSKLVRDVSDVPQPIAAPFGWSVTERLLAEPTHPKVDTDGTLDDDASFRKLAAGRVKSAVVEAQSVRELAIKHGLERKIEILEPPYEGAKNYFVALSRQRFPGGELIALLDELLKPAKKP